MMATKEQELKALAKIKKIVDDLGEDSYIGTAFEGCFEIAEENIENDFACSMKQRAESAEKTMLKSYGKVNELKEQLKAAEAKVKAAEAKAEELQAALDKELEWHDCEGGTNLQQERYEQLLNCGKKLTEDEAKELIYEEFGFAKEKVTIITEVSTYEANKYHQMRKKETFNRVPVGDATDWNYIRFNCSGWMYEMVNGGLKTYDC